MARWPISPREKSTKLAPFRLIAPLYEMLTAYLAKKLTFATPGPISRRRLDELIKHYGELADIPESKRHFHALKHPIATPLLDAGADLRFVQDWIGHASIRNPVIYAQLTSRRRDEEARKVFASQWVV